MEAGAAAAEQSTGGGRGKEGEERFLLEVKYA